MQTIFLRRVSPQEYLAEVGEGQRVGRGHPPGGELQQGPARGAVQAAGRGTCLATRTLIPTLGTGQILQTTKLLINLKRVSLVASACCPAAWRGRAGGRRSRGRWPPGSGTAAGSPWSPRPSVSAPRTPRHRHPCLMLAGGLSEINTSASQCHFHLQFARSSCQTLFRFLLFLDCSVQNHWCVVSRLLNVHCSLFMY